MTRTSRGRRTRKNGRETRLRALEVATERFSAAGYEATSLRQIASGAAIDLATLKYHFGDKPALYAEVYRAGHLRFLAAIGPVLSQMRTIDTTEQARRSIAQLATAATAFILEEPAFIRMYLYRLLEPANVVIAPERELQGSAVALVQETFARLSALGIVRQTDAPTLSLFLLTGLPMTITAALSRPEWLPGPVADSAEGRQRLEAALRDNLERILLA